MKQCVIRLESPQGDPERALHGAGKVDLSLQWRLRSIGDARIVGYQPKKDGGPECRQAKREATCTVGGRAGEAMPSKAAGDQVSSSQAPDTGYRAAGLVFTLPGVSLAPWYVLPF